jgi:endonuclease YncB( thermonuclease family)
MMNLYQHSILVKIGAVAVSLVLAAPLGASAEKKWRTYGNCELIPNDANDGDSFHVKTPRHYLFRLYWVDTPETDRRVPERVTEQAAYWGIGEEDTLRLGQQAAAFTREFLKDGFTVHTRRQDAMGQSSRERFYANVEVGNDSLAIALVRAGLARRHGFGDVHPGGPRESTFARKLQEAEEQARAEQAGAWGMEREEGGGVSSGVLPPRSPVQPDPMRLVRHLAPPPNGSVVDEEAGATTMVLDRTLDVYSLKDGRYVGRLKPGRRVWVLGPSTPGMARIRFLTGEKKALEGQCRLRDLPEPTPVDDGPGVAHE